MTHHHTHETTRQALAHIPANLPRDEWARIGMAIKSEFPDEGGYDLFFEWSATAPDFKANDCRTAWKSFKAGGSVTMGSLIHLAKQHGYTTPKDGRAMPALDPDELARRERERAGRRQQEQQAREAKQEGAAVEALNLWQSTGQDVTDPAQAPYFEREIDKHQWRG